MILPVPVAIDLAMPRAKVDEGYRAHKYLDPKGIETIGYGFNIKAGISERCAAALLHEQLAELTDALEQYWWWQHLDAVRASVVLEVALNIGMTGLLHFVNMLAAIGKFDWETAAAELLDSDAARELQTRYNKLADILRTGNV